MHQTHVFSSVSTKSKNNSLPRKQKKSTMKKKVLASQSGNDNIQYMLHVECDDNKK